MIDRSRCYVIMPDGRSLSGRHGEQGTLMDTSYTHPAGPLVVALVFLAVFNVLAFFTWGYGVLTFFMLIAAVILVLSVWRFRDRLPKTATPPGHAARPYSLLAAAAIVIITVIHMTSLGRFLGNPKLENRATDIAINTFVASDVFFGKGENPYTSRCQVLHSVTDAENVRVEDGRVTMFGVRYYYGYPYFPMMFISYAPFNLIESDYNAIRIGNLVFYLVSLMGVWWLARRLAPREFTYYPALLAVLCFTGIWKWGRELFRMGVTDIVIGVFLLYVFVSLLHRRTALAGILMGCALACKLAPGVLVFIVIALWLRGRPRDLRIFCLWAIGFTLALIVPFVVWSPSGFLSATILYYLTYHAGGTTTSLWYFMPDPLKTPLLVVGAGLVLYIFYRAFRAKAAPLTTPLTLAFVAQLVFAAFNRMTHLNYVWSVYALGCVALAVGAFSVRHPREATP
jgi:hypothetical protein